MNIFSSTKEDNRPFPLNQRRRNRVNPRFFRGGRLVLHKRKPVRDPHTAQMMALYRAREIYAPGRRLPDSRNSK